MNPKLYTPNEAAEYLRTTVGTLKQWRHARKNSLDKNHGPAFIKGAGIRGRILYRETDLDEFATNKRNN